MMMMMMMIVRQGGPTIFFFGDKNIFSTGHKGQKTAPSSIFEN
jgi:hypothetical protein